MARKAKSGPPAAKPERGEVDLDLSALFYTVTPEKLKAWRENAEKWKADPNTFMRDGMNAALVQIQFLLDVGLNPEPSKVGLQTSLQALRDYRELYELALDAMEEETKGRKR